MDKEIIINSIKKLREISKKRKFAQTFDLIINFKDINLKKPTENVNIYVSLPFSKGKKSKVCALVGPELQTSSKELFDKVILSEEFQRYKDKKSIKELAREYDYFIAQANLMAKIASTFGKVLGPRQKMPDPKAGCIVTSTSDLKPLAIKLSKQVRLQTKNEATVKCPVGSEDMKDEEIESNIAAVYQSVIHVLPNEEKNIAHTYLKLTMSHPVEITSKGPVVKDKKKTKEKKETKTKEKRKMEGDGLNKQDKR